MFAELMERLVSRRTEVAQQTASQWQQLVIDVADEKAIDPDEVLSDLDRLEKSPADLAQAVALLTQRRAWAATVAAGTAAEKVRPGNAKRIEAELAAFEKLEAEHESRLAPMREIERASVFAITEAATARGELARTATCPMALQAVRDADEKLAELRRERAEFEAALRTKEDRYGIVAAQKDPDLQPQEQRLTAEVRSMTAELATFANRVQDLTATHEAARLKLEAPEAI